MTQGAPIDPQASFEGELERLLAELDKRIVNGITISLATDRDFDTDKMLALAKEGILAAHQDSVRAELEKLHRFDGKDYDTALDEYIDERIDQLRAGLKEEI